MEYWNGYSSEQIERALALSLEVKRHILLHGGTNQYPHPDSQIRKIQKEGQLNVINGVVPMTTKLAGMMTVHAVENGPQHSEVEIEDEEW